MHGSVDLRVEDWNDMGHGEVHSYFVDMDGVSSSAYEGDMKVRPPFLFFLSSPVVDLFSGARSSVSVSLHGEEGVGTHQQIDLYFPICILEVYIHTGVFIFFHHPI